jgi:hypothetical protein
MCASLTRFELGCTLWYLSTGAPSPEPYIAMQSQKKKTERKKRKKEKKKKNSRKEKKEKKKKEKKRKKKTPKIAKNNKIWYYCPWALGQLGEK